MIEEGSVPQKSTQLCSVKGITCHPAFPRLTQCMSTYVFKGSSQHFLLLQAPDFSQSIIHSLGESWISCHQLKIKHDIITHTRKNWEQGALTGTHYRHMNAWIYLFFSLFNGCIRNKEANLKQVSRERMIIGILELHSSSVLVIKESSIKIILQ